MELKKYQEDTLRDLAQYIDVLNECNSLSVAYSRYWEQRGVSVSGINNDYLRPYINSVNSVPRVTLKVPTAGGKTFIACNAIKTIMERLQTDAPNKVVAWFVPSDTILKQTLEKLQDVEHPYRQRLDALFNHRVIVVDKESALMGQDISPTSMQENLIVFVLSAQSFVETIRTKNDKTSEQAKPRVYRENGNLVEHAKLYVNPDRLIEGTDPTALIQVIAQQNPLVIVDESHNFKNPNAKSTGALTIYAKKCKYTRILSGTPIGNSLIDLYSQFGLLSKDILGYSSFSAFKRLCENSEQQAKTYIYDKIKPYFSRVTLKECFKDIPEIMDICIKYKMTDKQKSIYDEVVNNNFIMESKDTTLFKNIIVKLQQIVSGYYIDTEGTIIEVVDNKRNPKIIALNELIETIEGKIIIWTKFKKEVVDIAKSLNSKYKFVIYTGDQNVEEKLFAKTSFKNNEDVKIIIMNIQSGAEGLTLPEADTSIYYSNTYSFLKRDQSEKRFITGNNTNPKTCYNLCSVGTLDSRILWLLKRKKQLSKEMIDREDVTTEDLKYLIANVENEK